MRCPISSIQDRALGRNRRQIEYRVLRTSHLRYAIPGRGLLVAWNRMAVSGRKHFTLFIDPVQKCLSVEIPHQHATQTPEKRKHQKQNRLGMDGHGRQLSSASCGYCWKGGETSWEFLQKWFRNDNRRQRGCCEIVFMSSWIPHPVWSSVLHIRRMPYPVQHFSEFQMKKQKRNMLDSQGMAQKQSNLVSQPVRCAGFSVGRYIY